MLPSIVKNLSILRKRDVFQVNIQAHNEEAWVKAQVLQQHIDDCGEDLYLFLNKRYFEYNKPHITTEVIRQHVSAYNSRTWENFLKKRLFYIYDNEEEVCECRDFLHYGYCKHSLAVKITLNQIQIPERFSTEQIQLFQKKNSKRRITGAFQRDD